jgi:hypothetical protein
MKEIAKDKAKKDRAAWERLNHAIEALKWGDR